MKRKINLVGQNTLTVSLPKKWVAKYGVRKGDEIEVEEEGQRLMLSVKEDKQERIIFADLTPITTTTLLNSAIIRLMMLEYKIIRLKFRKEINNTHLYDKRTIQTGEAIRDLISQQVGMEIIEEKEDSCTIKELSDMNSTNYMDVIRRAVILLMEYADFVKGSISRKIFSPKELDTTYVKKMYYFDKYFKFAMKLITHSDMSDSEKQRWIILVHNYEFIAYSYCSIGIVSSRERVDKDIVGEANVLLRKFYTQTFNPNIMELDILAQELNELQLRLMLKNTKNGTAVLEVVNILKNGILNLPFEKVIKIKE